MNLSRAAKCLGADDHARQAMGWPAAHTKYSESIVYRGRRLEAADIAFIAQLIAQNPGWSRRRLSAELCRAWNWVQPNGQLRDMVCRSLLLQLHRAGLIQLPVQRFRPPNNVVSVVEVAICHRL